MSPRTIPRIRRQRGFTLVTTLIFLAIFMLMAISLAGTSMINTRIAANEQYRLEARTVAQQGIEFVLSQPFTVTPITAVTNVPIDVNGDGKTDFTANVDKPVCFATAPVLNQNLNPADPNDIGCMFSTAGQDTGILLPSGAAVGQPPCQSTQWDVTSRVSDPSGTAASVVLHQGVSVRTLKNAALCP